AARRRLERFEEYAKCKALLIMLSLHGSDAKAHLAREAKGPSPGEVTSHGGGHPQGRDLHFGPPTLRRAPHQQHRRAHGGDDADGVAVLAEQERLAAQRSTASTSRRAASPGSPP